MSFPGCLPSMMPGPPPAKVSAPEIRWTDPMVRTLLAELLEHPSFRPILWPLPGDPEPKSYQTGIKSSCARTMVKAIFAKHPIHSEYLDVRNKSYTYATVQKLGALNKKYQALKHSGKLATDPGVMHYRDLLYKLDNDKKETIEPKTGRFTTIFQGKGKVNSSAIMTPPETVAGPVRQIIEHLLSVPGPSWKKRKSSPDTDIELEALGSDEVGECGENDGVEGSNDRNNYGNSCGSDRGRIHLNETNHSSSSSPNSSIGHRTSYQKISRTNLIFTPKMERASSPTTALTVIRSSPAGSSVTISHTSSPPPPRPSTTVGPSTTSPTTQPVVSTARCAMDNTNPLTSLALHEHRKIIKLYKLKQRSRYKLEKMHRKQDRKEFEEVVRMVCGSDIGHNSHNLLLEPGERNVA